MTRAYLAGPMSGIPAFNYPMFDWAAQLVELTTDWDVINPAELDRQAGVKPDDSVEYRHAAFRRDISALLVCDVIVMIAGWEKSKGARLEFDLAGELGMDVYTCNVFSGVEPYTPTSDSRSVLVEADELINGPRQQSYSHPSEDYGRTVAMFNAWRGAADPLTVEEGVAFMTFVKLSRQRHAQKRDNLVDAAGYIGCWAKVVGEDE